jgi:drug/metabolite transporter (DMT)-like permease
MLCSAVLLVLAYRADAIRPALRRWRPVMLFAIIEMAIPWILLATAEEHLTSGLTAMILAAIPIVGTIAAFALGDRHALRLIRIVGIGLGLGGVALLVGRDLSGDQAPPWWSVAMVLVVVVCYATAPFLRPRLSDVPSLSVVQYRSPSSRCLHPSRDVAAVNHRTSTHRLVGIFICTGLAFVVFFALINEVGPTRAGLITFANPVVAVALGAVFLDELVTFATVVGFVLVMAGCWLATRPPPGRAGVTGDLQLQPLSITE